MLLPDSMELRICVPYNSRSTAWASFDGRGRVELKRTLAIQFPLIPSNPLLTIIVVFVSVSLLTEGDHIKVTASKFPFPTVCADKQSTDWFHAIARTLKWNERERQKSFVVVEEGPARHTSKKKAESKPVSAAASEEEEETLDEEDQVDEDDDEEEEAEEDKFDIDDSSPEAANAQAAQGAGAGTGAGPGLPVENPKVNSDIDGRPPSSGIGTPDRFVTTRPHPPPTIPSHLISDAAERLRAESHLHQQHPLHSTSTTSGGGSGSASLQTHRKLQVPPPVSTSTSQRSPQAQREMQARGEDGERDFIRAPESLMQSNKSKIPRDRDVEADSMRTPRPDTSSHPHLLSPKSARHGSQQQSGGPWGQQSQQPPPPPPHRNHRRHGSVDSIGAPRRAFAAWGRDESDSNASDSDA